MIADTSLSLPYAHLNLRRNPFGTLAREEKNRLIVLRIDLTPYVERLRRPGYALQFLKEGARNKTTHLLAIKRHFPESPYIRLVEDETPPPIPDSATLFIDWFHAMPKKDRASLLKRPCSFAIVSHANHGREFKRAGLNYDLVRLPVYTPEQLTVQISRRIEWVRREQDKPVPVVSEAAVAALLNQYGNDDAVHAHLYEVFERLTEIADL